MTVLQTAPNSTVLFHTNFRFVMTIYDAISINEKILRIPWIVMELHGIDFIRTPPVLKHTAESST